MRIENRYFMVKNLSSGEAGQSAILGGDTYTFVKKVDDDSIVLPVGDTVSELTINEAQAIQHVEIFNNGHKGDLLLYCEKAFCLEISDTFIKSQESLTIAQGDVLFTELESSSHALSRGLVNISWSRFNATDDAIVTPSMKAFINAMYETFFSKYPRDLS